MGYSLSWLALRTRSPTQPIVRLGLRATGETAEYATSPISGHRLGDDWYLLVAKGCDHKLISAPSLAELSHDMDVIACSIEEHVMVSRAEAWASDKQMWRIEHDAQKSIRHLVASGDLPSDYAKVVHEAQRAQDSEEEGRPEVDHYFDVPLRVAQIIVGFKHDEDTSAVDYAGFAVYELETGAASQSRSKKWWQLWR